MTDSDNTSRNCPPDNKPDNKEEEGCAWYINSPEHSNCLWLYIKDKSSVDGSMPELVQSEIAQLLGWSNTKTHFMLKQAMLELTEALQKYNSKELISTNNPEFTSVNDLEFDIVIPETQDE